jgi:GrpB-like predicted nucleotidyltransferase (UPF0157 family)
MEVLRPRHVILAPHDPDWMMIAANLAEKLAVVGPCLLDVQHIGSTAIPGIVAKPIVDLMPLVDSLGNFDLARMKIERLGYNWHGAYGIKGRRYCTLDDDRGNRVAQLHVFQIGSHHASRHVAFRDYLRAHRHKALAYEEEKCRAQRLHPENTHAYSDEKSAWIRQVEVEALVYKVAVDRA